MKKFLRRLLCVALLAIFTQTVLGQDKVDMSDLISDEASDAVSESQARRVAEVKRFLKNFAQGYNLVQVKNVNYKRGGKNILVTTLVCADSRGDQKVWYFIDGQNFALGLPPKWEDQYTGETGYDYAAAPKKLYVMSRVGTDTISYIKFPDQEGMLDFRASGDKLSFFVPIDNGYELYWEDFLSPSYDNLVGRAAGIAGVSQYKILSNGKDDINTKIKKLQDNAARFKFRTKAEGELIFHSPSPIKVLQTNRFKTDMKYHWEDVDFWLESPEKKTAWLLTGPNDKIFNWKISNKMLVITQDDGRKNAVPILNSDIVSDMTDKGRYYSVEFQNGSHFNVLKYGVELFDGVVYRPGFTITINRATNGEILFTNDKTTVLAHDQNSNQYKASIPKGSKFIGKLAEDILSFDNSKGNLTDDYVKHEGNIYNSEGKRSFWFHPNDFWIWFTRNEELAKEEERQAAENAKLEKVIYQDYCTKYGKTYVDAALKGNITVGMPAALLLSTFDNTLSAENTAYKTYKVIPDIPTYNYKEKTITSKGSTHYHTRRLLVGVRNGAVSSVTVLHQ